jgi:hypothetical protein
MQWPAYPPEVGKRPKPEDTLGLDGSDPGSSASSSYSWASVGPAVDPLGLEDGGPVGCCNA